MAQVYTGDREVFRAIAYAEPDSNYREYVADRYDNLTNVVAGPAIEFMRKAKEKYHEVLESNSVRKARAILNQVTNLWGKDCIQPLETVTQVQNAPYSMRKYIMAEPTIRRLYHEGRCEGYGSSYVDQQPGVVGEDHLDYQKVDHGYVHLDEDGGWHSNTYSNNFLDHEEEDLTFDQQDHIRSVWDIVRNAVYYEVDPTSKRDSDL